MVARLFNMGLATWILVASAAFHPPKALFIVMLVVAFGLFVSEVAAFYKDKYRFWSSGLGVVLIVSGFFAMGHDLFLMWNNIICGLAIVALSMVRSNVRRGSLWVPWSRDRESNVAYEDTVRRERADVR